MARAWALMATTFILLAAATVSGQDAASKTVRVAILDSGIDATHAELAGKVLDRHSYVQPTIPSAPAIPGLPNPIDALRLDPDGQGTAVASKVAGKTLGDAKDVSDLVDLQVSGKYTGTTLDPASESAAAQAMDWLLANHGSNRTAGPRIALLSFANRTLSGPGSASLAAQAKQLWTEGVLVVVPMGGDDPLHASPYVLTVDAAGGNHKCTPSAADAQKPDILAAAKDVTVAKAAMTPADSKSATATKSGTPYAAAAVASAAAKVWAARSDLPLPALVAILRDTASDPHALAGAGCDPLGVLDVAAAVAAAQDWKDPTPTEPLAKPTPGWPLLAGVSIMVAVAAFRRKTLK